MPSLCLSFAGGDGAFCPGGWGGGGLGGLKSSVWCEGVGVGRGGGSPSVLPA